MTDPLLHGFLRSRFSVLLAALLFAGTTVSAQNPDDPGADVVTPVGSYEILKIDGSPVVPGWTIVSTITQPLWPIPIYVDNITVDKGDGQGPVPLPEERSLVTPDVNTPGRYVWENARGNSGTMTPMGNDFESEVTTGPNTGTKRKMKRLP